MPDVFTVAKRSEVMSRIRGHGNKETELALIRVFRDCRITGWRRHWPLFGKPDFVFPKLKLAIFVDGCFWHCCPKHANIPANNRPFWKRKLESNVRRDRLVGRTLRRLGWRVVRIWEHELAGKRRPMLTRRLERASREAASRKPAGSKSQIPSTTRLSSSKSKSQTMKKLEKEENPKRGGASVEFYPL